ncbi:uncharacterized protein LOC124653143 [Lolium rigidum]|uniref:uncharacterized protein LOC124653143 n=1 Tax=Lolium rigidum TaxID=89674 RepID=UPI001F5CBD2B|nr:uncharacterized protein LOC124653143 [Lolium rigidum]
MSRNEVHLNCRNKEEHTPLGLALLRLPRGLKFMQAPQRWILNDLVLAGAELDTRRLDHFDAYNYDIPDKEKHSEVLSKSAGLGAVCAVLILNISFAAPFNISKLYPGS